LRLSKRVKDITGITIPEVEELLAQIKNPKRLFKN
jgi:hypothetical protein